MKNQRKFSFKILKGCRLVKVSVRGIHANNFNRIDRILIKIWAIFGGAENGFKEKWEENALKVLSGIY